MVKLLYRNGNGRKMTGAVAAVKARAPTSFFHDNFGLRGFCTGIYVFTGLTRTAGLEVVVYPVVWATVCCCYRRERAIVIVTTTAITITMHQRRRGVRVRR